MATGAMESFICKVALTDIRFRLTACISILYVRAEAGRRELQEEKRRDAQRRK